MSNLVVLSVLLLLPLKLASPRDTSRRNHLRIIGGRDVLPEEKLSYVVRLEYQHLIIGRKRNITQRSHFCTGSVLTPKWTITCAHCFEGTHVERGSIISELRKKYTVQTKIVIRYGSPNGKPGPNDMFSEVTNYAEFPSPPFSFLTNDVILIQTQPILLKEYAKISAVDYKALYGHEVKVVGYGITNDSDGLIYYDTLELGKPLQLTKGMFKNCEEDQGYSFSEVCVVPSCKEPSWIQGGDSGGPVLHPSGIIALNSIRMFDIYEYSIHQPTDIALNRLTLAGPALSPYVDWIYHTINANNN